jgi:glutamyl-tRNA synthetase
MALFSYCYAKQHGGQFILRIEDTDTARSTTKSEQVIIDSLHWLGLEWDEGPDCGGQQGPYRQSERLPVYRKYAEQLLEAGHAFHCFCSAERLQQMRSEQKQAGQTARYDGLCAGLSKEEVAERKATGAEFVIRMKVPSEGVCTVQDTLRGSIEIEYAQIDMQVLMKADGFPTYHLAVVVDDHLMQISHIIRGEEWINSAPKHQLLYDYFGWPMPELIHMPLLRNPDKSKLSKRKNPTSISFYKDMGYLPEALLNYLGMLGWSMPGGEERFSLADMIDQFDINRISLGSPVFDVTKLKWLNGRWLREVLDEDGFASRLGDWAYNHAKLMEIIPLVKERVDVFSDLGKMISFFVEGMPDIQPEDFEYKGSSSDQQIRVLQFSLWLMESDLDWNSQALQQGLVGLAERMDIKVRDFLKPLFIAISGKPVSPPLFDSLVVLGPEISRGRLRHALGILGGVSKKKLKKLDSEFRSLS